MMSTEDFEYRANVQELAEDVQHLRTRVYNLEDLVGQLLERIEHIEKAGVFTWEK